MKTVRKWAFRLGAIVVLVALGVVLRLTVFATDPVPVEVEAAARGTVEETVTNSRAGTVKARRRAKLSPEIGGQVTEIPFREGDRVRVGDVLLRLDERALKARLDLAGRDAEAAAAEHQRACLVAERATREFQRVERLAEAQIASEDLLDQAESGSLTAAAACRSAAANESRARAAVEVARAELVKTVLRAPFDGLVAEVTIEVGEWTTPSPPALPVPPVLDLLDPLSLYISAPMDEVDSARIAVALPARMTVDSYREREFAGRVARVAPYVLDLEEQNRTVEIEVDFDGDGPGVALLPGTSADVEVILTSHESVLRVPTSALIEGRRLLLLEGDRLVEREVGTGLRNWQYTEIIDGLEEGELVVTTLDRVEVKAGALAQRRGAG